MPYQKILLSEAPKQRRNRPSRFERTKEWKMMMADLQTPLKPQEALSLAISDEDKKKYGVQNRRTIVRFLQKYLGKHKLPYTVKSWHRDGNDFFLIFNGPGAR